MSRRSFISSLHFVSLQDSASTSAPTGNALSGESSASLGETLAEAVQIRQLLQRNTEELSGVVTALAGGYVLPEAGGDLLRDGPGVLPTGVNDSGLVRKGV